MVIPIPACMQTAEPTHHHRGRPLVGPKMQSDEYSEMKTLEEKVASHPY